MTRNTELLQYQVHEGVLNLVETYTLDRISSKKQGRTCSRAWVLVGFNSMSVWDVWDIVGSRVLDQLRKKSYD